MALDFLAGCAGGVAGVLVGHPFDTVKVRLQVQSLEKPQYRGTLHCFQSIIKQESVLGLYKGLGSPLMGLTFINALVFGVQGNTLRALGRDTPLNQFLAGAHLPRLAGLPGADLPARGPARRQPGHDVHAAARDAQLRRLLPVLRRADARARLRARRPAARAQAAAGGRHVGHPVLAVHLPRGRGQVAAAGRRAAGRPALRRLRGLRAPELPRRGLARVHARAGLHAAARLPRQRRHLRHRHRGAHVRARPRGPARRRGRARRRVGAQPGPALQPVRPAPGRRGLRTPAGLGCLPRTGWGGPWPQA
ncbi:mitochondrial basic amino acids transporter isoform X1 [Neomonachus schauinslandi]|uniref:Mitochondrial basic amino acids transporter isoform X1 n=1 Tax=Neomonachus schauinslandi TaxID=29088 RepID=A0A2Y9GB90_NEOSC|nr:mitochondrial basic amino acids transporter isoform X1 [Neomonachus schauinslandi]